MWSSAPVCLGLSCSRATSPAVNVAYGSLLQKCWDFQNAPYVYIKIISSHLVSYNFLNLSWMKSVLKTQCALQANSQSSSRCVFTCNITLLPSLIMSLFNSVSEVGSADTDFVHH